MHVTDAQSKRPRELTGRMVLLYLVAFFFVVFAVNGIMVRAAIFTFGGTERTGSYQAGLNFGQEVAAAQRQDALHWQVAGQLSRDSQGLAVIDVTARDDRGTALNGLTARARLAHPADSRLDQDIALSSLGGGQFRGTGGAARGQWELIVDLYRGEARLFRSRSRVTLR